MIHTKEMRYNADHPAGLPTSDGDVRPSEGLCEEATLSGDVVLEKDHQYFIDHEIFFQDKHAESLR